MNNYKLPDTGFIRLQTVLHHIPIGKSSWWAGIAKGRYPRPYKIGPRTTVWKVEDIRGFINSQRQASSTVEGVKHAKP